MTYKLPQNGRARERGFTLIQVLVTLPILGIIVMSVSSYMVYIARENSYLSQKLESLNLKQVTMAALLNSDICVANLSQSSADFSDATLTAKSNQVLSLTSLTVGANNSSLARVNESVGGTGLRVSAILFKDVVATLTDNQYWGVLEIQFEHSSLTISPISPIRIDQLVEVDPATNKVSNCLSSPSQGRGNNTGSLAGLGSCPTGSFVSGFSQQGGLICTQGGSSSSPTTIIGGRGGGGGSAINIGGATAIANGGSATAVHSGNQTAIVNPSGGSGSKKNNK